MRWPWQKAVSFTAEQEAHIAQVVTAHIEGYRTDWGPVAQRMAKELGISRLEAFTYLMINHLGLAIDAIQPAAHPRFNAECSHCIEQREQQERLKRYMERCMKYMDEEEKGDDWKPIL